MGLDSDRPYVLLLGRNLLVGRTTVASASEPQGSLGYLRVRGKVTRYYGVVVPCHLTSYLNVASLSNLLNVRRRCHSRARSQERQPLNATEDHGDVPQTADLLVASVPVFNSWRC
jgi:hypothetical protein